MQRINSNRTTVLERTTAYATGISQGPILRLRFCSVVREEEPQNIYSHKISWRLSNLCNASSQRNNVINEHAMTQQRKGLMTH